MEDPPRSQYAFVLAIMCTVTTALLVLDSSYFLYFVRIFFLSFLFLFLFFFSLSFFFIFLSGSLHFPSWLLGFFGLLGRDDRGATALSGRAGPAVPFLFVLFCFGPFFFTAVPPPRQCSDRPIVVPSILSAYSIQSIPSPFLAVGDYSGFIRLWRYGCTAGTS